MIAPIWIIKPVVLALHEEQLAEHSGVSGLRDEGLLDSALDRPKNKLAYGTPDIFDLGAAYAFGLAKNHAFNDGNKRVSLVVSLTFLLINGFTVTAPEPVRLQTWLAIADGRMTEDELASWLRQNSQPAVYVP